MTRRQDCRLFSELYMSLAISLLDALGTSGLTEMMTRATRQLVEQVKAEAEGEVRQRDSAGGGPVPAPSAGDSLPTTTRRAGARGTVAAHSFPVIVDTVEYSSPVSAPDSGSGSESKSETESSVADGRAVVREQPTATITTPGRKNLPGIVIDMTGFDTFVEGQPNVASVTVRAAPGSLPAPARLAWDATLLTVDDGHAVPVANLPVVVSGAPHRSDEHGFLVLGPLGGIDTTDPTLNARGVRTSLITTLPTGAYALAVNFTVDSGRTIVHEPAHIISFVVRPSSARPTRQGQAWNDMPWPPQPASATPRHARDTPQLPGAPVPQPLAGPEQVVQALSPSPIAGTEPGQEAGKLPVDVAERNGSALPPATARGVPESAENAESGRAVLTVDQDSPGSSPQGAQGTEDLQSPHSQRTTHGTVDPWDPQGSQSQSGRQGPVQSPDQSAVPASPERPESPAADSDQIPASWTSETATDQEQPADYASQDSEETSGGEADWEAPDTRVDERPTSRDGITIMTLTPNHGPAHGGTPVTIRGEDFPERPFVSIGGAGVFVAARTPLRLTVIVPSGTPGTSVDATISDSLGHSVTMSNAFWYD